MAQVKAYKTKQRAEIEEALKNFGGEHITADELCERLSLLGKNVGRTTVYRCLEKLISEGKVRRYEGVSGQSSCYQYIGEEKECREHFHLKCVGCGELIHIECKHIDELCGHIGEEHSFEVDKLKTVLYGVCSKCRNG